MAYIDRKALRDALYDADAITMNGVKILNRFPSADVAPVRHGRWEKSNYHGFLCCSGCKDVYIDKTWFGGGKWNYCPNCGAVMEDADA